ncbi:unnamed protein product [Haemonchus placei]|uniref:RING-type domain-containing protein n=1 Tax=Haemonchus placei TaxID=6290 RepID=A0A0N4X3U1_HAEPC|nr:unnamed protein product [Haemonchus placei]
MNTLRTNSAGAKSTALVSLPACGICFQPYNEAEHLPKVLSCGHTNCITCLSRWQSTYGHSKTITCTVCRNVTSGPITSIPNNYQLMGEVLLHLNFVHFKTGTSVETTQIATIRSRTHTQLAHRRVMRRCFSLVLFSSVILFAAAIPYLISYS